MNLCEDLGQSDQNKPVQSVGIRNRIKFEISDFSNVQTHEALIYVIDPLLKA